MVKCLFSKTGKTIKSNKTVKTDENSEKGKINTNNTDLKR